MISQGLDCTGAGVPGRVSQYGFCMENNLSGTDWSLVMNKLSCFKVHIYIYIQCLKSIPAKYQMRVQSGVETVFEHEREQM